MNEYEKNTCITFVPRTEEVDYIVITAGGSGLYNIEKSISIQLFFAYLV